MDNQTFEQGLRLRKQVLGETYVNTSIEQADDFSLPLQQPVTQYCREKAWTRDMLSLQQRSLIELNKLVVLNQPHELKLHIKGALHNGLSRKQIRKVLLHVAIYCGMPAVIDSFRLAREVFANFEAEQ